MKYKFHAQFKDGSIYRQNDSDVSELNPGKSCFYNILKQEEAGNPPILFELTDDKNSYLVNLLDGHFEINGIPFWLHEKTENLKLIFFRSHTISFGPALQQIGGDSMSFTFGWQIRGTNIQKTITLL